MKKSKIMSLLLSGIMTISALGSIAVSAEEKKIYTFSELDSMSKEEFLSLDNAMSDYESIKYLAFKNDYMKFRFVGDSLTDSSYKYGKTEETIYELFGDSIEFDLNSPATAEDDNYYYWYITVNNDNLVYTADEITDEKCLFIAKSYYCLKQVCNVYYSPVQEPLLINILFGDANKDGKVNIIDAAFIAKKVAGRKANELPETADFNKDGKKDILDAAKIAKLIASKR